MKGIIVIIIIIVCFGFMIECNNNLPGNTDRIYKGTVVLKDKASNEMGDTFLHIYYYCPEIGKDIKVSVSASTYSRLKLGDNCSFLVTPRQAKDMRPNSVIFPK